MDSVPADADRHVVADQPPAAPRQARPVLLAPAGRERPDPTAVWVDAPVDLDAARADGRASKWTSEANGGRNTGEVSEKCSRN